MFNDRFPAVDIQLNLLSCVCMTDVDTGYSLIFVLELLEFSRVMSV